MRVYLDNAATTPVDPRVIDAITDVLQHNYGNPSSIHHEGRNARTAIEAARRTVAQAIGASVGEIFFTSGGTESNNMALKCSVRDLEVKRIISTRIEHHCVLHTLECMERQGMVQLDWLDVDERGMIDLQQLQERLAASDEKTLVSLMHSNNEIGTMIDLNRVAAICREAGALFHTDTVQTMGYYPIDVNETPVTFLSGSAHKFHGPKGVGFIYINGDHHLKPFIDGGSQERNMRGGTENIYGIVGLAKALELAIENRDSNRVHVEALRQYMRHKLLSEFEDIRINGADNEGAHYKVLSVSFPPDPKNDLLLLNLDIAGISASGGSACSSGAETGSHVLNGIGGDPQRKTIRFSFSHHNSQQEIDFVLDKLRALLPQKVNA